MSSTDLAVSCIIPTHDRPHLLREALASVLNQTADLPIEIIVVDDADDPETADAVADISKRSSVHIHYEARRGGRGASESRNIGAALASGRYLAFLDDDDLWEKDFLYEALRAIEATTADLAISYLYLQEPTGRRVALFEMPVATSAADAAARNPGLTGSNFVISKSKFVEIGGFDAELSVSNDKDFLVRFLLSGSRYQTIPRYLAIQRQHSGSRLSDQDTRRANGMEVYLSKHRSTMSFKGRRYIRMMIHRSRLRASRTTSGRIIHALGYLANASVRDARVDINAAVRKLRN